MDGAGRPGIMTFGQSHTNIDSDKQSDAIIISLLRLGTLRRPLGGRRTVRNINYFLSQEAHSAALCENPHLLQNQNQQQQQQM